MKIRSLGRKTDLIFAKFSGSVVDKGSYTVIQTPNNPGFHWGNYIIFDHPPKAGSYEEWTNLFKSEFPYYDNPGHFVFTWDTENESKGEFDEFLSEGFEFDSGIVLVASKLNPSPHFEKTVDFSVRKITSEEEWEDIAQLQTLCADPKFEQSAYLEFKRQQMSNYKKMSQAGMGNWFGAYIEDKLVADLGIFYEGEIGRYQNVGTHPDFRRRGICGALVYKTGLLAFKEMGVKVLVMEADIDYHAARIYQSVGFAKNEINYALSWCAESHKSAGT
ncbi:MAG: GNAT family N-acetyltransferase [Bacteriovoracaceae bacterium]|nr:GNAT family N-acetyltransferase [Bacteriovoracaceae bacterium]